VKILIVINIEQPNLPKLVLQYYGGVRRLIGYLFASAGPGMR